MQEKNGDVLISTIPNKETHMGKYEVHIKYTKESGKGNKKGEEVVVCDDMMAATMLRLDKQEEADVENVVVRPHERNDFPFDDPDIFK